MFHHRVDDGEHSVLAKWYLLSFLSGNVNAGGFLAVERFVTHVTGFSTLFGIDLAEGKFDQAIGILSVPGFFLCGSMISAYLVDLRFHRGQKPYYDRVMLLVGLCLTVAALAGSLNAFGVFGEELELRRDYILLALLCLASGLQNAAITTATGASVRTTHLTGITTDLGIGLVKVLGSRKKTEKRKKEIRANWHRIGTVASFTLGSVTGALLFLKLKYLGFALPAALAFYAMFQAYREPVHAPAADGSPRGTG